MTSKLNRFGEVQTDWTSHKHPDISNFMQVVKYMHIQKNGVNTLYWRLFNSSSNDFHLIKNITLEEAKHIFSDNEVEQISEADFQKWLESNNK